MEPTSPRPLIRQQRALVACTHCRQRKIKCEPSSDRSGTACKRCQKQGLFCEYKAVSEDLNQDEHSRRAYHSYSPEERSTSPLSHLTSPPVQPYSPVLLHSMAPYSQHDAVLYPSTQHTGTLPSGHAAIGQRGVYGDFAGAYSNGAPCSPSLQPHGLSSVASTTYDEHRGVVGRAQTLTPTHVPYPATHDYHATWNDRAAHEALQGEGLLSSTSPAYHYQNAIPYPGFPVAYSGRGAEDYRMHYPDCQCHACLEHNFNYERNR
ncbi:hypothetical protein BD626DRAFT_109865 [Schizophyllum amplum]|uniref:Zn(2)-C6 fungal-type domain-containing protein n=1 Tax=Schizophyllum amplum TaxID=97359 RepID=A0A550CTA9_9AGAR|nr:hypothetical protein BD626DRAFT_109865 [Auriculariopsis ampla]